MPLLTFSELTNHKAKFYLVIIQKLLNNQKFYYHFKLKQNRKQDLDQHLLSGW